jgi:methyl-accepting chemotaxis protein
MRNLKVWQKLALMGVIFLIPFALVTMKMVSAIDTLGVDFAAQELRGLRFTGPGLTLVKDLQQHRGVAGLVLNGETAYRGRLDGIRGDVEKDLAALDALDRELGAVLHTTARWKTIRAASADLLAKGGGLSPDESFARHSRLIGDVIALVGEVGRTSNLTLDPDAGRAHLVTVLVASGPELTELLARARGIGSGVAASKDRRADLIDQLNRQSILMESVGTKLDASMAAAIELMPVVKANLEESATAASDAVLDAQGEILKLTGRAVRGDGAQGTTPDAYFAALSRGIEAVNGLQGKLAGSLQSLLTERMASLRQDVRETLAWALVGLLVVSLFGIYVMRDVTVTLRDVVTVANHIAAGDLSVRVQARERRDELGVLGHSFDQMVHSFKDLVGAAERIAAGDLAVTVTPRSDRDALGHALSNMAGRLSGLLSDVHRSGIQVNTSVNEIAASAREQEATATEVAAATTEIAATSREIAATSQELVRTMGEVFTAAEESAALAGQGQAGLTRMEATMRQVMEASSSINNKLAVLNEKAGNINHVVTTITKVADQTNLLSLNAAIEAEKAGEYGRGFAVVATEIRRLADQTAVATYDIDRMVKEIQSAVAAGVMGMDKFSDEVRRGMHEIENVSGQLTQIIHQVQALAPRCEVVSDGMQAQATGAGQITEALAQLSDAAQQTIQSLRQSTIAIDGLNQAATSMHGGVSRFKLAAA